jgi:hypothetical protein
MRVEATKMGLAPLAQALLGRTCLKMNPRPTALKIIYYVRTPLCRPS